ncbi:MAG: polyprenyl synthetase family protein [SAR86 cluster bacterium]|uniref:Polyprenyl synthetase family protein n=1 Tax=SAR86 cluster bacterium TaxID=2030880 RepID=A0A937M2Y0_9GAMM|nr:polyprenyl synthetase family protein [SAR86 cluster bacterium]
MPVKFLTRSRELVHNKLSTVISSSSLIDEAMRYSVLSNSKAIRPGLVMASGILNDNLTEDSLITLACSVELIHTYSLIHDDLPSMDDDDLRRGKDSSHIRFGEANAILAGDALHDLAFELIATDLNMSDAAKVTAVNILAKASGSSGMVLGQYLDIESEKLNSNLELKDIEKIHSLKTGKLIRASILMGQLESSLDNEKQSMLSDFGSKIGLAFQIFDDILDETGDSSVLGKSAKSDIKNNKQTYVKVIGLEESNFIADQLATESIGILDSMGLGEPINTLKSLAEYMVNRNK